MPYLIRTTPKRVKMTSRNASAMGISMTWNCSASWNLPRSVKCSRNPGAIAGTVVPIGGCLLSLVPRTTHHAIVKTSQALSIGHVQMRPAPMGNVKSVVQVDS